MDRLYSPNGQRTSITILVSRVVQILILLDQKLEILCFSVIVCGLIVLSIIRSFMFYALSILTAKKLHEKMLNSVVGTKVRFFDTNPIGRIMNRFSMDVGNLDDLLPSTTHEAIYVLPFFYSIF
jgi:ABC-type bacteriocin/lantibiotic exporter with double-glycine peptidase domain